MNRLEHGFKPNWSRNPKPFNHRTYVRRVVKPLRLCRHTHEGLTCVNPAFQFGTVKSIQLDGSHWIAIRRSMNFKELGNSYE